MDFEVALLNVGTGTLSAVLARGKVRLALRAEAGIFFCFWVDRFVVKVVEPCRERAVRGV